MKKLIALVALVLVACGEGGSQPPDTSPPTTPPPDAGPKDAITKVTVTGPNSLAFNGSTSLKATVEGTGSFTPLVTWSIHSGGGQLSASTGETVTYTAPLVRADTLVTIYAVSQMDASKFGAITINVTKPPPAGTFLAGSYAGSAYESIQDGTLYGRVNPPRNFTATTTQKTYVLTRVSDTQVMLTPVTGFPNGIPVDLNENGTLTIRNLIGEAIQSGDGRCTWQYIIGQGPTVGSGTWDYNGNLSLNWFSKYEGFCSYSTGGSAAYKYYEHRATVVRQ
jgi:hypothetical protein